MSVFPQQLLSDIDLISYNARIYNGDHHEISKNANEFCEIIRVRLKQAMFIKSETFLAQQVAASNKAIEAFMARTAVPSQAARAQQASEPDEVCVAPDHTMIDTRPEPTEQTMPATSSSLVRIVKTALTEDSRSAAPNEEESKDVAHSTVVNIKMGPNFKLPEAQEAPSAREQEISLGGSQTQLKEDCSEEQTPRVQSSAEAQAPAKQPAIGKRRSRASAGGPTAEDAESKTRQEEHAQDAPAKRVTRNNLRKRTRQE